jgi:hypothetical protein
LPPKKHAGSKRKQSAGPAVTPGFPRGAPPGRPTSSNGALIPDTNLDDETAQLSREAKQLRQLVLGMGTADEALIGEYVGIFTVEQRFLNLTRLLDLEDI